MPFEGALAHGGMTRNRCDGRPALGVADHRYGCLNLRRDALRRGSISRLDPTGEEAFHGEELLLNFAGTDKDVLDPVDLLLWQDSVKRYGPVVEKVCAIVQYGRSANLSEPNDYQRGTCRVLDHAGSSLQTGDDCVRKSLVVQRCQSRLS
jgi:hypothetical protein